MGGFYPKFPDPKPGPQTGSSRPANAPNAGASGGRPPTTGVVSASPFERLLSEIAPLPPGAGAATAPATTPPQMGEMWPDAQGGRGEMWPDRPAGAQAASAANPNGATPPAAPASGITINVGGAQGAEAAKPAGAAAPADPTAAAAGGAPVKPPPVSFPRAPDDYELARVQDGTEVVTPYGTGVKRGGVVERYRLTPAGQEAHKRATLAARTRFGRTPFDNDGGPQWPVVLDGYNYNPWSPPGEEWSR